LLREHQHEERGDDGHNRRVRTPPTAPQRVQTYGYLHRVFPIRRNLFARRAPGGATPVAPRGISKFALERCFFGRRGGGLTNLFFVRIKLALVEPARRGNIVDKRFEGKLR
jgi:hypothetical protein